jgi:hypothetical protein
VAPPAIDRPLTPEPRPVGGDQFAADIGVPAAAYARLGLTVGPVFATGDLRTVTPEAVDGPNPSAESLPFARSLG